MGGTRRQQRAITASRFMAALLVCGLVIACSRAGAAPARYEIDPEHFTVAFLVHHLGFAKVLGLFQAASGSFQLDEATGELTDLRIVVETKSVFTNHPKRDEHLRGPDFFNVDGFPEMVYFAPSAEKTAERAYTINGELTLLGVTQPLALSATWNKSGKYPYGFSRPYVTGISARGRLERSAFGMTYALDNGWVGDEVEILIELEAKRR